MGRVRNDEKTIVRNLTFGESLVRVRRVSIWPDDEPNAAQPSKRLPPSSQEIEEDVCPVKCATGQEQLDELVNGIFHGGLP